MNIYIYSSKPSCILNKYSNLFMSIHLYDCAFLKTLNCLREPYMPKSNIKNKS